ncbi:alpha/beta hydrolase [Escherichia coli]|nr:alpha/beta hydrolase [Escherichia coli]
MAYIDSVYFTDMGPDTGRGYPPLLFLHGFFMDSRMFEKQISVLKEKYRVICIDIRGFGGSKDHRGPFSLYDIAGDVIKVADHLNIRKFVIAGMSMGDTLH